MQVPFICLVGGLLRGRGVECIHWSPPALQRHVWSCLSIALSSDGDACIMRCEMKLGASRRVLVGSFKVMQGM
jgi:hypothetical protein